MKRRVFLFLCVLSLISQTVSPAFALEGEAARAGDLLYTLGLLSDTSYRPKDPATRLYAVTILVKLSGLTAAEESAASKASTVRFTDVSATSADVVRCAAGKGWVSGVSADHFAPDRTVTANAWYTMLLRMLGYSDKAGEFMVGQAPQFARRIGVTTQLVTGSLTRGQLLECVRDVLPAAYRSGGTVVSHLVEKGTCSQAAVNALGLSNPTLTARQAADRYMPAVFRLSLFDTQEAVETNESTAEASGFFISPDGIAVTCYHAIDGTIKALATLVTEESYEVERVLWYDVDIDLAVLKVSKTSTERAATSAFAYLNLTGSEDVRPGDIVYTLGNPLGYGLAVSDGVVSAVDRVVERYAQPCIMNTADISQGSSGGALLNEYGHVIAVTSGAYRSGNNMYLAVPVDPILTVDTKAAGKTLREVATEQAALAERELSQ